MEQTLHLGAVQSRTHTIYTIQELLLEYSLAIIVLGCFLLEYHCLQSLEDLKMEYHWHTDRSTGKLCREISFPESLNESRYIKAWNDGCIYSVEKNAFLKVLVSIMWTENVWSLGFDKFIFSYEWKDKANGTFLVHSRSITSMENNIMFHFW